MANDNILEPDEEPISLDGEEHPISLTSGEDEPISLVEPEVAGTDYAPGSVRAFGVVGATEGAAAELKRALNTDGSGATRCRVFHSKIAIASLEFMEKQINEWLDSETIEIKHVGHLIGTMEGKRPEPNILVMVWY